MVSFKLMRKKLLTEIKRLTGRIRKVQMNEFKEDNNNYDSDDSSNSGKDKDNELDFKILD